METDRLMDMEMDKSVSAGPWRSLSAAEIEALEAGGNSCRDWSLLRVSGQEFRPERVRGCRFSGTVRIGRIPDSSLEYGPLRLPAGIYGSYIDSCDIGDGCAVHNVGLLGRYVVCRGSMLFNVQQMTASPDAAFGCAVDREGAIAVMNESGRRSVLPFVGMNTADAYLWGKYRDDAALQERLAVMTLDENRRTAGGRGLAGEGCIVKNTVLVEDVRLGAGCVVDGAQRLRNLTVCSSADEPTHIEGAAMLEDGIVGYGNHIYDGCTARRFVTGSNCTLKSGLRLYDSIAGDNSTLACGEVVCSLIFPAHEQHHNSSFLIAACVGGQSNIASGATLGSNHNSRASDGELVAGRGFWPGLCTSVKHSSSFASYTLLVKGAFPAELDVRLPFSLVADNEKEGVLEIMPAYWWMYNQYALARNASKYRSRDRRVTIRQNIEFDTYAPDSMEEVMQARRLLALWTGMSVHGSGAGSESLEEEGAALLSAGPAALAGTEITAPGVENSRRKVRILKAAQAYAAYSDMIRHYAAQQVLEYFGSDPHACVESLNRMASGSRDMEWVNLGGQLVRGCDVEQLRADIVSGKLPGWDAVHGRYDGLFRRYPEDRLRHALHCLVSVEGWTGIGAQQLLYLLSEEERICRGILDGVVSSREKDFDNPFRRATFRNCSEMDAVAGSPGDDGFIRQVKEDTAAVLGRIARLKSVLS